ncbi:MAG: DUF72 domain-containing protein [Candidatus Aminicenantes bacterium]|nr:DUF72 domain-containing protein [Candidatus Aminicenantes bacterium]
MSRIYVGTAGWSYEDWRGIVYPEERGSHIHPLSFLARYIDCVEVNSTFYRTPPVPMVLGWLKAVAAHPDFQFAVKLHQAFTHERRNFESRDADLFKKAVEPIAAAGRLAALLLQFPWSYQNTGPHREYLTGLFNLFAGYPLALEVRHGTWDDPAIFTFLREHRVAFCNLDQPVIGSSLKPTAVVTDPRFAYVRLHGRNYKDWFREGAGRDARYNYLYAKNELDEWVERIKELGRSTDRIYVVTNNHYRGQALANALQIKNLTSGKKLEVPEELLKQYPVLEEIIERIRKGQLDLFDNNKKEL